MDCLLNPRTIAIIGASSSSDKIGNVLVKSLLRSSAKIFPVNPKHDLIEGIRCYHLISDVPDDLDLAIIALPAEKSYAEFIKVADHGVKCAIFVTAGFSEMGNHGRELEKQIIDYARSKGTRVLGPNTLGVYSPITKIDTLIIPAEKSPRPDGGALALISQSGSVHVSMLEKASSMAIGISYSIGLGNRADISEIDMLKYLADDDRTRCIALYLESFSDGRALIELAKSITPKKPIVAIKAGRTEAGSRAASSHTGAISRSGDDIVDGAFHQSGIIRAYDDEELLDYANALMLMSESKGDRVAYIGSAGGVGVMASDYIESEGIGGRLRMAKLSDATKKALSEVLEAFAPLNNPVDLTASSSPSQYDGAMHIVAQDQGVDMILLSLDMQPPMMDDSVFDYIKSWAGLGKPIVGTSTGGDLAIRTVLKMQKLGIPSYPSLSRCIKSARILYERGKFLKQIGNKGSSKTHPI
ncbi:MAG: CoA-binding protein [Thermoplasmata archaeon]|nr:CoA-binding protein [Thermoplasmata archaeon]